MQSWLKCKQSWWLIRIGKQSTGKLRAIASSSSGGQVKQASQVRPIDMAEKVTNVLLTYVSLGTEGFTHKFGSNTFEKVKSMLTLLKEQWAGDEEASDELVRFERKPNRYRSALADILQERLAMDETLKHKLSQLLQGIGSVL